MQNMERNGAFLLHSAFSFFHFAVPGVVDGQWSIDHGITTIVYRLSSMDPGNTTFVYRLWSMDHGPPPAGHKKKNPDKFPYRGSL